MAHLLWWDDHRTGQYGLSDCVRGNCEEAIERMGAVRRFTDPFVKAHLSTSLRTVSTAFPVNELRI